MSKKRTNSSTHPLPPTTEQLLDALCHKMTQSGYPEFMIRRLRKRIKGLHRNNSQGIEPFLRKLSQRVNDRDEYLDILMEGRFAIALARNGFTEIHLEYSTSGPDIKADFNGNTVYFEVTRRRAEVDEWKLSEPDIAGFVGKDKTENVIVKILGKVRQLQPGEMNVILVWSDTFRLGVHDVKEAVKYIQQEIAGDPSKYQEISGVLFTTGGVNMSR